MLLYIPLLGRECHHIGLLGNVMDSPILCPPYWISSIHLGSPRLCCNGGRCNPVGRTHILPTILDDSSTRALQWTRVWVRKAAILLGNPRDPPTPCLPYWILTLHLGSPRLCCNARRSHSVDMAHLPSWMTHPARRCNRGSVILSGVIQWYITQVQRGYDATTPNFLVVATWCSSAGWS